MQIQEKQVEEMSRENFMAFMKAQYPTIKSVKSCNFGSSSGCYTLTDGAINLTRKEEVDIARLPSKATVVFCNKTEEGSVPIDWSDAIEEFERTRQPGINTVRGHICELGFYNPLYLTADIKFNVGKDAMSLENWFKNGAKIDGVSYANAKTAQDLAILSEFDITAYNGAFEGMTNLVSAPVLTTKTGTKIVRVDRMFYGCSKLKEIPVLPSFTTVTNFSSMFTNASSIVDASGVTISQPSAGTAEMFMGCTSLVVPPKFNNLSNCVKMFYDCSSLPEEFPTFNISSTTFRYNHTDIFGGNCSVKKVKIRINTSYEISDFNIDLDSFGANVQEITVLDQNNKVRETFVRE